MSVFAGLFLGIFGALGAWFLTKRFPHARFLRTGYVLMSAGGVCFVIWGLSKSLPVGVAAAALLALGGAIGVFGALRKELRLEL